MTADAAAGWIQDQEYLIPFHHANQFWDLSAPVVVASETVMVSNDESECDLLFAMLESDNDVRPALTCHNAGWL